MQIRTGKALHFKDYDGIFRCGVIRDFCKFDDGMILTMQVKSTTYTILDSDIVMKPSPRWCD